MTFDINDSLGFQAQDDSALDNLLGDGGAAPAAVPVPPRRPSGGQGGLRPLINQKSKTLNELLNKLANHKSTGVYMTKLANGQEQFDYSGLEEDKAKRDQLMHEINQLERRERDFADTALDRKQRAQQIAVQVFRDLSRSLEDPIKRLVAEQYATTVKEAGERNEWAKPEYADQQAIQNALTAVFDATEGSVRRRMRSGDLQAPASSGLDSGHDPKKQGAAEVEPEDAYANQAVDMYTQRKQSRGLSIADLRRQQFEAAQKGQG